MSELRSPWWWTTRPETVIPTFTGLPRCAEAPRVEMRDGMRRDLGGLCEWPLLCTRAAGHGGRHNIASPAGVLLAVWEDR